MSGGHLAGWRLSAGDELTVMDGSSARLVSVNCGGLTGRTVKEGEDCARLIAAAPELLEALENLANAASATSGFASPMFLNDARAAIAKARDAS